MPHTTEFMDVADSDFLSNKEHDDDCYTNDSEFESDFEKYLVLSATKNRLFSRRRSLYVVLGSEKFADVILWRKKKISASVLVVVTFIWFFYMRMDYTLLSFTCDSLILMLAIFFIWTHLTSFINISPPKLSNFILPEGFLANTSISVTYQLNQLLIIFGVLASGNDLKKFLMVTVTLGAISIIDIWFTAPTILYIASMILLIVPAVYERNEDIVEIIVDKAMIELNNRYAELLKKFFGYSKHLHDRSPE